jgi:hypothetical protein
MEKLSQSIRFKISLTHDICNLDATIVRNHLRCAFQYGFPLNEMYSTDVKQIFMVREPVSRAISVYYFWGELFKLEHGKRRGVKGRGRGESRRRGLSAVEESLSRWEPRKGPREEQQQPQAQRRRSGQGWSRRRGGVLGSVASNESVVGPLFTYHGSEHSPPPAHIALAYAQAFPFRRGFPGPSLSHSAFASNASQALAYMRAAELFTVVLERLDESLVVLRHFLGWSLADVVVTKKRKALSTHPTAQAWPQEAVQALEARLRRALEYDVYALASQLLDGRVRDLQAQGVDVAQEVRALQALRAQATATCMNSTYLELYKRDMQRRGYLPHPSQNKLRDVEEEYAANGHLFSLNGEILGSFDVCGSCEAHALLLGGAGFFQLQQQRPELLQGHMAFHKCPQTATI